MSVNSIRITSGALKGRKIATPGGPTHPMGERERLALFNMITGDITGASVLDAFAGSGALGIEALSRGANSVLFVEQNATAVKTIRENLANLGLDAEVFRGKVSAYHSNIKYDLILADPPYDDFDLTEVSALLPHLTEDGVLVLSHPDEAPELKGVSLIKSKQYAGARISVYARG